MTWVLFYTVQPYSVILVGARFARTYSLTSKSIVAAEIESGGIFQEVPVV